MASHRETQCQETQPQGPQAGGAARELVVSRGSLPARCTAAMKWSRWRRVKEPRFSWHSESEKYDSGKKPTQNH